MAQNRRQFILSVGAAVLGAATGARAAAGPQQRRLERIGLQLYTVRRELRPDAPETMRNLLRAVAEMGYKEVEFAGYNGLSPAEVRAALQQHGLTSPSTHVAFTEDRAAWQKILADSSAIGHAYVTVPSLPRSGFDRATADGWKQLADKFNSAGADAKSAGLRFAFHNHDSEFREVEGRAAYDILLANTDPELVSFQIDIYWMVRAGKDPLEYYGRFPNRFPMVHVKDSTGAPEHRMVDVGAGAIDFRAIFARGTGQGTKHFFVEHDNPADPMASVRASHAYLSRLEF